MSRSRGAGGGGFAGVERAVDGVADAVEVDTSWRRTGRGEAGRLAGGVAGPQAADGADQGGADHFLGDAVAVTDGGGVADLPEQLNRIGEPPFGELVIAAPVGDPRQILVRPRLTTPRVGLSERLECRFEHGLGTVEVTRAVLMALDEIPAG